MLKAAGEDGRTSPGQDSAQIEPPLPRWRAPWSLLVILILSLVGPAVIGGVAAWQQHRLVIAQARDHVRHTLGVLHEHAERVFQVYDIVLNAAEDRIRGLSWAEIEAQRETLRSDLQRLARGAAQIANINLIDARGDMIAGTPTLASRELNFSDRAFFKAQAEHPSGTHVSAALVGRVTGKIVFVVSRRIPSASGRFEGLITISSDQDYWHTVHDRLDPAFQPSFVLVRAAGDTIVRMPPAPDRDARPSARFLELIKTQDEAYYEAVSAVTGMHRLIGYRKMSDRPLYVGYTISKDAVLAEWRRDAAMIAAASGVASLALFTIALLLRRHMRGEWRAQAELALLNRSLEGAVAARTAELSAALAQKDVALREIHHRIKNNLQVVASLLTLHARQTADVKTLTADTVQRINTIGLIHEKLHRSSDARSVEMGEYLNDLCQRLLALLGSDMRGIGCEMDAEEVHLDLDRAVPLALAISEMISNSMRHAFPDGRPGRISLSVHKQGSDCRIEVRDDGVGIAQADGGVALGTRLITALVQQAGARLERLKGGGTGYGITLPLQRAKPA